MVRCDRGGALYLDAELGPIHTGHGTRRAMGHKQMGPIGVNGVSTLHTSNIKGKTFKFAGALRPASCVDWALAYTFFCRLLVSATHSGNAATHHKRS